MLNNYVATNTPKILPLKTNANTIIRVENVNEGKIPPNTEVVEIIDQKTSEAINIKTTKSQSYQINLTRE